MSKWCINTAEPKVIYDDDGGIIAEFSDSREAKRAIREHNAFPLLVEACKAANLHADRHPSLGVCNCANPGHDFDCESCSEVSLKRDIRVALATAGEETA